jgi:electron transport complex protein RnfC
MRVPHDFSGGIRVDEAKRHRDEPAQVLPLPQHLRIPLATRHGTLKPCVRHGQAVLRGQPIATDGDGASDVLNAPTSGRIAGTEFDGAPWLLLEPDGQDRAVAPIAYPTDDVDAALDAIRRAGIVGLGGGGFPLHTKLAAARAARVHTLLVNAVECEPWLTSDETLLVSCTRTVHAGIDALARVLGAPRVVVAIDPRKTVALARLARVVAEDARSPGCELLTTPPRYPAGSERALVEMLRGVPLGRQERPLTQGYVCVNVATAHALGRLTERGEAVTERLVSITGPAVPAPGTAWVRLGHVTGEALAAYGMRPSDRVTIKDGGPLSGRPIAATDGIGRTTLGLFVAAAERREILPCIHCARCAEVCPERLEPQLLHRQALERSWPAAPAAALDACIECGACDVVCPSAIPLLDEFRAAKDTVRLQRQAAARAAHARARFEAHVQRLDASLAQTQARRTARLAHRLAAAAIGAAPAQDDGETQ